MYSSTLPLVGELEVKRIYWVLIGIVLFLLGIIITRVVSVLTCVRVRRLPFECMDIIIKFHNIQFLLFLLLTKVFFIFFFYYVYISLVDLFAVGVGGHFFFTIVVAVEDLFDGYRLHHVTYHVVLLPQKIIFQEFVFFLRGVELVFQLLNFGQKIEFFFIFFIFFFKIY